MNENFDRQYRLKVGVAGQSGFEAGKSVGNTGMPLRISFQIEKSDDTSSNSATVKVWNLNKQHRSEFRKEKCRLELQAGYGENLPLIFCGYVTTVDYEKDGADRVIVAEAYDGLVELKDTYISVTYAANTSAQAVVDGIASKMSCAVVYSPAAEQALKGKKMRNGFSAIGHAKDALSKICETCGLAWTMQNGVIQIVVNGQPISERVYVLSPPTGLIGEPKLCDMTDRNDSNVKYKGYEVEYLLNGAIGINDLVYLDSGNKKGFFKVFKLTISGDNFQSNWSCKAEMREVVV